MEGCRPRINDCENKCLDAYCAIHWWRMNRYLAWLVFLFSTASGWADGMVVHATAVPAEVRIPDQRALIQFSNGVERLVIETRFTGAGTNFAWVVPLPSPPVIEEASTGLFPTLQCVFQPRLRHEIPRYFQLFLGLVAGAYLVLFVRGGSPVNFLDLLACLALGLAFFGEGPLRAVGGMMVFLGLLFAVECIRLGTSHSIRGFTLFLLLLFLAVFLLPVLGSARSAGMSTSSTATVSILDRKMVGVYETATISSRDPAALQGWLKSNGFAAPASRDQAIAGYVQDGWVFVAAKIRRDDPTLQTATPHPLSFIFETGKAVYPMRLTGIDNGAVQVDLYVFGSDRAEAPHFKVERCTHPAYPKLPLHHGLASVAYGDFSPKPESVQIAHPLLRKWVDGAPVATKLTASLSPADMRDDVWISWAPFSEKGTSVFSHQGAWIYAANWGAGVFAATFAIALVFGLGRKNRGKRLAGLVGLASVSGIVLAAVIYMLLPKTEIRFVRGHRISAMEIFRNLDFVHVAATQETNLAEVRASLADGWWWTHEMMNHLSGGYIREEDSPGNYELRQSSNGVEFVIYDACGAPSSE
jgi:hypothetical protein